MEQHTAQVIGGPLDGGTITSWCPKVDDTGHYHNGEIYRYRSAGGPSGIPTWVHVGKLQVAIYDDE